MAKTQAKTKQPPPPTSSAVAVGLPDNQFRKLCDTVEARLQRILDRTAVQIRRIFVQYAADIAQCSRLQLQYLKRRLRPLGVGFRLGDMVDKAAAVGAGTMAVTVALSDVTFELFDKLPTAAQKHLNADKPIPVRQGAKVIAKPLSQMSEKMWRRAISGSNPHWGLLHPKHQDDPRPRPKPVYYKLVACEKQRTSVVATFRLGQSEFKSRLTAKDIAVLADTLTRPKRTKRRRAK